MKGFAYGFTMNKIDIKRNAKGFSLIELSVLLAITGILAAISVPMLTSSLADMQLISDARNIATSMTHAKLGAISQLTHYRLSFALDQNEWSIEKWDRTSGQYALQKNPLKLGLGAGASGIAFHSSSPTSPAGYPSTSSPTVTFNSRGIPVEGSSIVYLSNDEENFAVSASISGKIQVWRYRDNQWLKQ